MGDPPSKSTPPTRRRAGPGRRASDPDELALAATGDGSAPQRAEEDDPAQMATQAAATTHADEVGLAATRTGADGGGGAQDLALERPGRYRVRLTLGRGGQSRVFLAHDTLLGRDVALKQPIDTGGPGGEAALARFLREAEITARLEHPNIVPVYDIGRRGDGSYFCAQKLIGDPDHPPRTLRSALAGAADLGGRLALLSHFVAVCNAVAFAHEHAVIHRDLKPDNVVVGRLGETVVLDWGLAKVIGEEDTAAGAVAPSHSPLQTVAGAAFGTPAYMSPEQAAGRVDDVGPRSDVWSLGAILYEILTGRPPHAAPTAQATLERVRGAAPKPVRSLCPEAPPELAAVAEKAIARDPADRYASATELAADTEAYQENARVGVYRYSALELVRLFVRRHRALVAVATVAAVLVSAAAVVATLQYRQASIYLGDARESLARALVEKGRRAQARLKWDRAAAYFAAARTHADLPEARWGARLAEARLDHPLTRFAAHEPGSSIHSLAFSPDGRLVSASDDGTVRVWDLDAGAETAVIDTDSTLDTAALSPDGARIATGQRDGQLALWSIERAERLDVLYEHADAIHDVAFSRDGRRIAAGTADYRVLVYDLDAGRVVSDLRLDKTPVYGVAFDASGDLLAAGWDGRIRRIDLETAEVISEWRAHDDAALAVAVAPDGQRIATAGRDALAKIWRLDEPTMTQRLAAHSQKVYAAAFSPDGSLLATGGADGTLRMWDVASGRPLPSRSLSHGDGVGAIAFSPDGSRLAWAGTSAIWVRTLQPEREVAPMKGRRSIADSPKGHRFVAPDGPRKLAERTLPDMTRRRVLYRGITGWRVARTGDTLAFFCGPSTCVFDAVEGEVLAKLGDGHRTDRRRLDVALSPDAQLVAVARQGGRVEVWDVSRRERSATIEAHQEDVHSAAFSPDGKTLATGGYEGTVALWEVSSWQERARLRGHARGISRIAFSPDGRLLATASWDHSVRLWDAGTGEPVAELLGHGDQTRAVAFFPSGETLVSGARDGTLRFWDVPRATELGVYRVDERGAEDVQVACGGDCVVYSDRAIHVLALPEQVAPARQLERILTRAELAPDGIDFVREPAPPIERASAR